MGFIWTILSVRVPFCATCGAEPWLMGTIPRHSSGVALAATNTIMPTNNRVLIVEDDPKALSGYVEFLIAEGFEPTGVPNGAAALPIALGSPPAAVVTDITLPGMTGFELAAALRADSRTQSIPIIGLTAHWSAEVHTRARDVAMQVILSKPCIPAHLVAELNRVLGARH
jgi:CheY-like chemotaxis protein